MTGLFGHEITRFANAFGLWTTPRDFAAESGQQAPQPLVEEVLREAAAELPTRHPADRLARDVRRRRAGRGPRGRRGPRRRAAHEIAADYLLGCDGSSGISRTAIGARYEGSSGKVPNLSITFRSRALEERELCALGVHYWVIGARARRPDGPAGPRRHLVGDRPGHRRATSRTSTPVALVRSLVGADIDVDVLATDPWSARMLLVDRYRGRARLPRRRRRAPQPAVGRARLQHLRRRRRQPRLEAGRRPAGLGARRRCSTATRPSAVRSPQRTIAAAGGQEAFLAPSFAAADLDADGPAGEALRADVARRPAGQGPGVPQPRPRARLRLPRLPRRRPRRSPPGRSSP